MFLTAPELRELTGYQRPKAQIRWLQTNGVQHYVRADGKPVVPRAAITSSPRPKPAPNFAALRQAG